MHSILRLIKRATLWILRSGPSPLDITRTIHRFGPGVTGLSVALNTLITPELRAFLGCGLLSSGFARFACSSCEATASGGRLRRHRFSRSHSGSPEAATSAFHRQWLQT